MAHPLKRIRKEIFKLIVAFHTRMTRAKNLTIHLIFKLKMAEVLKRNSWLA